MLIYLVIKTANTSGFVVEGAENLAGDSEKQNENHTMMPCSENTHYKSINYLNKGSCFFTFRMVVNALRQIPQQESLPYLQIQTAGDTTQLSVVFILSLNRE